MREVDFHYSQSATVAPPCDTMRHPQLSNQRTIALPIHMPPVRQKCNKCVFNPC